MNKKICFLFVWIISSVGHLVATPTVHDPVAVVSITNINVVGLQTIDDIKIIPNNRVLLVGQLDPKQNGLWLCQTGAWIRPDDFTSGTQAGVATVFVTSGAVNAGTNWVCITPTAIIDTNSISFIVEFILADQTTGANVGGQVGQIFRDATGNTINFKTIGAGDSHVIITNNTNDVIIGTDATSANIAGAIVSRDSSGDFSANTITANLIGNITGSAGSTSDFTGSLLGDVTGIQGATVVSLVGGQPAADVAAGTILANTATDTNTINTIVKRDGSGNFSAGTITADLMGNVTGNATSATTATNFSGPLTGDVTGTQNATVVSTIGGQMAANVATGTILANTATNANTASTLVKRDASGNFSAGTVTANLTGNVTGSLAGNATTATTATNFSGSLTGDVTGNQSATVVSTVGGQTAANVAAGAVLANAATATNTANTIVRRDNSGNFSAGTMTASLTGAASLNVLKTGDTMTGGLIVPAGTTATPSIQFTGSVNTGIAAQIANILSFDTNGIERMNISTNAITTLVALIVKNIFVNQAIQTFAATGNNQAVVVTSGISLLLLTHTANRTGLTITFPPSPIDGQMFTVMLGTTNSITFTALNGGTGAATIVGPLTGLNLSSAPTATANGNAVTYLYTAASNSWYRYSRG